MKLKLKKDYEILLGDCLISLKGIKDGSIDMCITSPPYYGLRDYNAEGQLGMEESPDDYINNLVKVFAEVKRILKDDGTLWVNIGDSYAANRSYQVSDQKHKSHNFGGSNASKVPEGMKPKDLIGIPWMLAFALRAEGWYLRQDIIWNKPNAMPESVKDRCVKSHEYIFLLSKSKKYHFDYEAIKELTVDGKNTRSKRTVWDVNTKPFKGAHFATFPPELILPAVKAGCRVGGVVLDPFGGSGTTAGVASFLGRKSVICELNAQYAALIHKRVADVKEMLGANK